MTLEIKWSKHKHELRNSKIKIENKKHSSVLLHLVSQGGMEGICFSFKKIRDWEFLKKILIIIFFCFVWFKGDDPFKSKYSKRILFSWSIYDMATGKFIIPFLYSSTFASNFSLSIWFFVDVNQDKNPSEVYLEMINYHLTNKKEPKYSVPTLKK